MALVAAAPAQAATLTLVGSKSCYRAGDTLTLNGAGFTPGGQASITLEGKDLGVVPTDAAGNFSAPLSIGSLKGVSTRTLIATDAANPANVGQAQFLGSSLGVTVKPRNGGAGRKLRINASGLHHRQAPLRARRAQALPAQRVHREAQGSLPDAKAAQARAAGRPADRRLHRPVRHQAPLLEEDQGLGALHGDRQPDIGGAGLFVSRG